LAYPFDDTTLEIDEDSPHWSAARLMNEKIDWDVYYASRVVATYNGTDGVPFAAAYLNVAQKEALLGESYSGQDSQLNDLVDYLKGKSFTENPDFRMRTSRLADIVHSSAVFEDDILYVGANDGMLHAFDIQGLETFDPSETNNYGRELFAYIPSFVFPNLRDFTLPDYRHHYYVDLTPSIWKARGLLSGGSDIEKLLVGGLGRGGKGYYALNITDARDIQTSSQLADRVLWEYPHGGLPTSEADWCTQNMGYSYSKPVVVRSNDPDHPWIVLFGNGYESTTGNAALIILNARTGAVVKKIMVDNAGSQSNGLSSPIAIDVTHDDRFAV
jgi:Tfp pilus tip-associated adhesin PilY1